MLFQIKLGCTDRRGEHCSPVFFILCLPYGKLLNNTSSVTKGDTFPSSYAGEDTGLRRETQHRTRVTRNNTVSAAPSTPGSRNHRIRDCVNAPLKKLHRTLL